jgi:hypothetical protein
VPELIWDVLAVLVLAVLVLAWGMFLYRDGIAYVVGFIVLVFAAAAVVGWAVVRLAT